MSSSKRNIKVGRILVEVGHNPDVSEVEKRVNDVRDAFINLSFSIGNLYQPENSNEGTLSADSLTLAFGDADELCRRVQALEEIIKQKSLA